jgi:SnoaL-like domain
MDAAALLRQLAEVIDGHRWDVLPTLLKEDFTCRYVHTGEQFDRDSWVRLNAEYPGFERFLLEDAVACGERAVGLARVTGTIDGQPQQFAVATFVTVRDRRIGEMTEVWTDVGAVPYRDTRPS